MKIKMKIIGWLRKGNVIRFALSKDTLEDWSGYNWEAFPYEHKTLSTIPDEGIESFADVVFDYDVSVLEAKDDWSYHGDSPFCMDDFKKRKAPILIIDPEGKEQYYSDHIDDNKLRRIYMGDNFDEINWRSMNGYLMNWKEVKNDEQHN